MLLCTMVVLVSACTPYKIMQRISSGEVAVGLAVPGDDETEEKEKETVIDSVAGYLPDGPILMNAIRDTETGDMVATDVISASKVTARFRNVPERGGYVTIGFDVTVPSALTRSAWKMELLPKLIIREDTLSKACTWQGLSAE